MDNTEWELRFKALGDIEGLLKVAAPQYRSPQDYFTELIINEEDKNIADKRLKVLEDLSAKSEEDKLKLELERVVRKRDKVLQESDWTQLADAPLDNVSKRKFRAFRHYLRDLPKNVLSGKNESKCMKYSEWCIWIETVRHTPGYEQYVP